MAALFFLAGDQLSFELIESVDKNQDWILLAEVMDEAAYVPHHPQKLVLFFSAMRHFAQMLKQQGYQVVYVNLDDPDNTGSLRTECQRWLKQLDLSQLVMTELGEYRLRHDQDTWAATCRVQPDPRFIADHARFAAWAKGKKQLRMEYFYRELRRETNILMELDGKPTGGQWNYDTDNRKSIPNDVIAPTPPRFEPDVITQQVIDMVRDRFGNRWGRLEGFAWPVTREQAQVMLDHFIQVRLVLFGDYQDAMRSRKMPSDDTLWHSLVAASINLGLLDPLTVCRQAEAAYRDGLAPLNAVEGFIRQILGWREYVRGIYWRFMPDYKETNFLSAQRSLPKFYWTGDTDMHCLSEAIGQTLDTGYAHHIQRLMVTGNFALLIGAIPQAINEWYLSVYLDAIEWVQLPNTHGMAVYADGGIMASKPYAASGKYIDRMSDYCKSCRYSPKESTGPKACPFNALYWHFIDRHQDQLGNNPRMGMIYRTWSKMDPEKRKSIIAQAGSFLNTL